MPSVAPGPIGLASAGPQQLALRTEQAWRDFRQAISTVDLTASTRVKRRSPGAVIAKVGDWPESRQLPEIVADARAGRLETIDQDAIDERVMALHQDEPLPGLLAAVDRAIESLAEFRSRWATTEKLALLPVGSPLGVLPVLTYLHAAAFQLAVAARDLGNAGVSVPDNLISSGLAALVDTTGALAARMKIDTSFAVQTQLGTVITTSTEQTWTVTESADRDVDLPGLRGDAALLIDMASGRRNPIGPIRSKQVQIRDMSSLMKLAPIAQANPGLPGGPILRRAAVVLGAFRF